MLQTSTDILKKHGLRKTGFRVQVLDLLLSRPAVAISQSYIEEGLDNYDRITLYRTLKSFEKLGIIHKAIDGGDEIKYALCHDDCNAHQHSDDHAHFFCQKCGETFCLDHQELPEFNFTGNYKIFEVQLALSGICNNCN